MGLDWARREGGKVKGRRISKIRRFRWKAGGEEGIIWLEMAVTLLLTSMTSWTVPLVLSALVVGLVVVASVAVRSPCWGYKKKKEWFWPFGSWDWHLENKVGILTLHTDDLGPVPFAVGVTLDGGNVALEETVTALVTHHRVYVIMRTLPTNQESVVHGGRSST